MTQRSNQTWQPTFFYTNYLINYFSSWMKLKTSVAWFLGLKQRLKLLRKKGRKFKLVVSISGNGTENKRTTVEKRMHKFKTTISKQGLYPEDYAKEEQAVVQFVHKRKVNIRDKGRPTCDKTVLI